MLQIINPELHMNTTSYQTAYKRTPPRISSPSAQADKHSHINPLNTKRRPLYLKTQFVPRSKHFSSRL